MANVDEQYKCQKCGKTMIKSNKLLHDLRCNPSVNVNSNNSNNSLDNHNLNNNFNNNNFNNNNINNNNLNNYNYNLNNNIIFNNNFNNNINNYNNNNINPFLFYKDFIFDKGDNNDFLCDICGLKLKLKDKADHLLCHQMELNGDEKNIENIDLNNSIGEDSDRSHHIFDSFRRNRNRSNLYRNINLNNSNFNRYRINSSVDDDNEEDNFIEGNALGDSDNNSLNIEDDGDLSDYDDGLDEDIIQSYPISKIKDIDKLDEEKKKCLICIENFKNNDDSIILPCIHIFHSECIKKWMKKKNLCPICKSKIDNNNKDLY